MFSAAAYDHSDCDCFGCAILSHGREGFVYATDRLIPLEALTVPFKGDRCPTLVGKPKLFFIQVCILPHKSYNRCFYIFSSIHIIQDF